MKKIASSLILLTSAIVLLTSCGSVKNVAYLQNSDYIDFNRSEYLYDARIMPKDVLTITVNTVNPEASAPYNLVVRNTLTSTLDTAHHLNHDADPGIGYDILVGTGQN